MRVSEDFYRLRYSGAYEMSMATMQRFRRVTLPGLQNQPGLRNFDLQNFELIEVPT